MIAISRVGIRADDEGEFAMALFDGFDVGHDASCYFWAGMHQRAICASLGRA